MRKSRRTSEMLEIRLTPDQVAKYRNLIQFTMTQISFHHSSSLTAFLRDLSATSYATNWSFRMKLLQTMKCSRCGKSKVRLINMTVIGKYGYFRCMNCSFTFFEWVDGDEGQA